MNIEFVETYAYSMAHTLPTFPDGHKCRRVHGHTNEVTIVVRAGEGPGGYWLDHARLGDVAQAVIGLLDHRYINDIPGLEDGLAETQLTWIVRGFKNQIEKIGGELIEVHLDEWSSCSPALRKVRHRKSWRA
jgi:6-pyruvoyltetrahydropterin/6-carboxytetrahydropterin synthase